MLRNATPRVRRESAAIPSILLARYRFISEGSSVTIAYYAAFRVVLCRIGSPFYVLCELG